MTRHTEVAGGGIAGLSLATMLVKDGWSVRIHERLAEIRLPTLVVTGEDDVGSNARMARLMYERIEGSRLHILARLRHSILIEAPDVVADVIEPFLAESNRTTD